ncbi:MAG: S1C family serine protease, partial [Rhodospirillales bacterium]
MAAAPASIRLVGVTRSSAPIASGIETVQRAVVTVRGGDGHGSGFYVGNDGDVVTNHHVVGSARRVKLRHHDGRELDGAAVATDDWRDVALVRAAAAASQPLPVLRDIPPAGAEVYAVRSPLAARLQSTVTRGIVSSLRRIEGLSMIQSDVAIQPGNSGGPLLDARGNVVGIAVAG